MQFNISFRVIYRDCQQENMTTRAVGGHRRSTIYILLKKKTLSEINCFVYKISLDSNISYLSPILEVQFLSFFSIEVRKKATTQLKSGLVFVYCLNG